MYCEILVQLYIYFIQHATRNINALIYFSQSRKLSKIWVGLRGFSVENTIHRFTPCPDHPGAQILSYPVPIMNSLCAVELPQREAYHSPRQSNEDTNA
jgi:hypothetical protein